MVSYGSEQKDSTRVRVGFMIKRHHVIDSPLLLLFLLLLRPICLLDALDTLLRDLAAAAVAHLPTGRTRYSAGRCTHSNSGELSCFLTLFLGVLQSNSNSRLCII